MTRSPALALINQDLDPTSMDPAIAAAVNDAATAIRHANAARYTTVAGFMILLWDHLIMFDDEVNLIWPARRSFVKAIFMNNRYLSLIFQAITAYQISGLGIPSSRFCQVWNTLDGAAEVASAFSGNFLLLLRVFALWDRRKDILYPLLGLFFATNIAVISTTLISTTKLWGLYYWSDVTRACHIDVRPPTLGGIWVAPVLLEIVIFVMTVIKAVHHWRTDQLNTPLLKSLYRDSILCFVVIIVLRIAVLIIWAALPITLVALCNHFVWAIMTAMVSRILLNLRNVASPDDWTKATAVIQNASGGLDDIVFARPEEHTLRYSQWTDRVPGSEGDEKEAIALVAITAEIALSPTERDVEVVPDINRVERGEV